MDGLWDMILSGIGLWILIGFKYPIKRNSRSFGRHVPALWVSERECLTLTSIVASKLIVEIATYLEFCVLDMKNCSSELMNWSCSGKGSENLVNTVHSMSKLSCLKSDCIRRTLNAHGWWFYFDSMRKKKFRKKCSVSDVVAWKMFVFATILLEPWWKVCISLYGRIWEVSAEGGCDFVVSESRASAVAYFDLMRKSTFRKVRVLLCAISL